MQRLHRAVRVRRQLRRGPARGARAGGGGSRSAILLVAYDTDYPAPMHAKRPMPDAFGMALVLTPRRGDRLARAYRGDASQGARGSMSEPQLEALRSSIPAARCAPAAAAARARRVAAARCSSIWTARASSVDSRAMRLNRGWIEAHIPHSGRMCLLDEVLEWDARAHPLRERRPSRRRSSAARARPSGHRLRHRNRRADHGRARRAHAADASSRPRAGLLAGLRERAHVRGTAR